MADITAAMVKELRERTSVGMMDCKKALQENDGNIEAAIDWLRAKGLSKAAKNRVGTQSRILDAFVFHNFSIAEREGNVRVGQQVVSWGESTFIQGGINAINPVDVSKLRVAGAELKNAFLPVNMLWTSYNFSDTFSAEFVYLFDFRRTDPDPVGTYFSTNDFAVIGGRYVMLNFGTVPQPVINPDLYDEVCRQGNLGASDSGLPANLVAAGCSAAFPRSKTRDPKDSGQGGFALRYLAEGLNNTEFGFYALNYHSRVPLISGISVTGQAPNTGSYFTEYPENIHLFGISFNSQLEATGIALQGELSYRPNQPFQVDDVDAIGRGAMGLLADVFPTKGFSSWRQAAPMAAAVTATRIKMCCNFMPLFSLFYRALSENCGNPAVFRRLAMAT